MPDRAAHRPGRREGAQLVTGGTRPSAPELANRYFIQPTVFYAVHDSMRIAREEIFGPVMSVMTWTDVEDAFARAHALSYGLTAAIVTNDRAQAMEASYVWVDRNGRYRGAPYGGWKASGFGVEETFHELLSYTQIKNVHMRW